MVDQQAYIDARVDRAMAFNDKELSALRGSIERVDRKIEHVEEKLGEQIRHLDLKIGSLDEKLEGRFQYLGGRIDVLEKRLGGLEERFDKIPGAWNTWAAAGAIFLGFLTVMGFAGDRFNAGMGLGSSYGGEIQRSVEAYAEVERAVADNSRLIDALNNNIDELRALVTQQGSSTE